VGRARGLGRAGRGGWLGAEESGEGDDGFEQAGAGFDGGEGFVEQPGAGIKGLAGALDRVAGGILQQLGRELWHGFEDALAGGVDEAGGEVFLWVVEGAADAHLGPEQAVALGGEDLGFGARKAGEGGAGDAQLEQALEVAADDVEFAAGGEQAAGLQVDGAQFDAFGFLAEAAGGGVEDQVAELGAAVGVGAEHRQQGAGECGPALFQGAEHAGGGFAGGLLRGDEAGVGKAGAALVDDHPVFHPAVEIEGEAAEDAVGPIRPDHLGDRQAFDAAVERERAGRAGHGDGALDLQDRAAGVAHGAAGEVDGVVADAGLGVAQVEGFGGAAGAGEGGHEELAAAEVEVEGAVVARAEGGGGVEHAEVEVAGAEAQVGAAHVDLGDVDLGLEPAGQGRGGGRGWRRRGRGRGRVISGGPVFLQVEDDFFNPRPIHQPGRAGPAGEGHGRAHFIGLEAGESGGFAGLQAAGAHVQLVPFERFEFDFGLQQAADLGFDQGVEFRAAHEVVQPALEGEHAAHQHDDGHQRGNAEDADQQAAAAVGA
jgi:hypothetical protein